MALKKYPRRRMPTDGTWVRTEAHLNSIVRSMRDHSFDLDYKLPPQLDMAYVPVWVKMIPHIGRATPQNPEAVYYHPVVKVCNCQEEIEIWSSYAAGLSQDCTLDGHYNHNHFHYHPLNDYPEAPGEDTSQYECDICKKTLYRDETGRRYSQSACIQDGGLVCRDCEVDGAVYAQDVADRLVAVRALADQVGPECRKQFERQWEFLGRKTAWGQPNQTRIWKDGEWSFYWRDFARTDAGPRKPGMNGGLIMHGPHTKLNDDGSYTFRRWDYSQECEREATPAEVAATRWSIHT